MSEQNLDLDAEYCISVASVNDIVTARQQGRVLAERLGFSAGEATLVATARRATRTATRHMYIHRVADTAADSFIESAIARPIPSQDEGYRTVLLLRIRLCPEATKKIEAGNTTPAPNWTSRTTQSLCA